MPDFIAILCVLVLPAPKLPTRCESLIILKRSRRAHSKSLVNQINLFEKRIVLRLMVFVLDMSEMAEIGHFKHDVFFTLNSSNAVGNRYARDSALV